MANTLYSHVKIKLKTVLFVPLGWFHSGKCHPHCLRPADALLLLHCPQITEGNT